MIMIRNLMHRLKDKTTAVILLGSSSLVIFFILLSAYHPEFLHYSVESKYYPRTADPQNTVIFLLAPLLFILSFILFAPRDMDFREDANPSSLYDESSENMNDLFSAVREQRHDFTNHLATIHIMVQLGKYKEANRYIEELAAETHALNKAINIGIPSLSGFIHTKVIQAEASGIAFEYELAGIKGMNLNGIKSTDLVKILSNVLDNAFDAVLSACEKTPFVKITGSFDEKNLLFTIENNGPPIPEKEIKKIFKSGFTTKISSHRNSGLGLAIVMRLIHHYNGLIEVESDESRTIFQISLPLV